MRPAHERVADHPHADATVPRTYGSHSCVKRVGHVEDGLDRLEGRSADADRSIAVIISSTCSAISPEARCGSPRRIARTMSTTPLPRPAARPARRDHGPLRLAARRTRRSPSNRFGSGTARVASVPVISTKPHRCSGESQLNSIDAAWPPAYSASAEI